MGVTKRKTGYSGSNLNDFISHRYVVTNNDLLIRSIFPALLNIFYFKYKKIDNFSIHFPLSSIHLFLANPFLLLPLVYPQKQNSQD